MRVSSWLWTVIVPGALHAQAAPAPPCTCAEALAFVVDQVERNYAGFPGQVTDENRGEYERLKAELHDDAASLETVSVCREVLGAYIDFFHDRHLGVGFSPSGAGNDDRSPEAIRARFADWPRRPISESAARAYFHENEGRLDPIEGIWETVGAAYRLAILRAEEGDGRFEAVTLRADSVWWSPGQIKATLEHTGAEQYEATYYMRDHTPREAVGRVLNGVLVLPEVTRLAKVYPENPAGYDPERYAEHANDDFAVRRIDSETALVQLPRFSVQYTSAIDSMIEANRELLRTTPHLIVDVRGNGGGASGSYESLRALLYTGPVVVPGLSMYATEDNIRSWREVVEDPRVPDDLRPEVEAILQRMIENAGGFTPEPDDTVRMERVLPEPRRVVVLTDRGCASSCEAFVLEALQSEKVTVVGTNTGGLLDYGNVMNPEAPCSGLRLSLPIARSNRLPEQSYDFVGVPPEIRLPDHVLDPLRWVHERLRTEIDAAAWP